MTLIGNHENKFIITVLSRMLKTGLVINIVVKIKSLKTISKSVTIKIQEQNHRGCGL